MNLAKEMSSICRYANKYENGSKLTEIVCKGAKGKKWYTHYNNHMRCWILYKLLTSIRSAYT